MSKSVRHEQHTILGNIYLIVRGIYTISHDILATMISLLLIFLLNSNNGLARATNQQALEMISSIYHIINVPLETFYFFADRVEKHLQIIHENESLKEQNYELQHRLKQMDAEISDNITLKKLLNVADALSYNFVTAKVISKNFDNFHMSFLINAGRKHGISEDDIVIYGSDLIGRVIEVSNNSARILSISDPQSKVPIIFTHSKEEAIMIGNPHDPRLLNVKYLYHTSAIENEEPVVTSGIGGVFPLGIMVGQADKVGDQVFIATAIEWNKIDYVIVILKTPSEGEVETVAE